MSFRVYLHPKAASSLARLQASIREGIRDSLRELQSAPEKGEQIRLADFWRLRIGDYRAIYEIDRQNKRIVVLFIGHRKNVYDDFSRLT